MYPVRLSGCRTGLSPAPQEAAVIHVQLPDADLPRLEGVFRDCNDPKLRDRVQIVLMAHRGRQHQDIAADLAVTPRTVQRWLNAYLAGGLDGLRPRKAPGKPAG